MQKKLNPLTAVREDFDRAFDGASGMTADKFMTAKYFGLSALTAREIALRGAGRSDAQITDCDREKLWSAVCWFSDTFRNRSFEPWLVSDAAGRPVEVFVLRAARVRS